MELIEFLATRWFSILTRATIILGSLFLVFWVIQPKWIQRFRIPQPRNVPHIAKKEWWRTVVGLSVYLIPITSVVLCQKFFGYSQMYTDIAEHGWLYFFFSFFLFMVIFDTWFYWAHRLMHIQPFLRRSHGVHHRAYNPTPVSAYAFDFVEAVINMMPYWIGVMLVPWHPTMLVLFSALGMAFNGYLHLGYDFAFQWRMKVPVLNWIFSSTHHSVHHQRHDGNFGLYFTFWDRLMGTERAP